MTRHLPFLLVIFLGFFGLGIVTTKIVLADGSGSGSALVAAGSFTATPSPTTSAADKLVDPVADPLGAVSDLKDAKSKGWPFLVLVILIFVTKIASYAGGKFAPLGRFLAKGKNAMIVAGVGTILAACLNTLANQGNWYAVGAAAVAVGLALVSSRAPATAVEKHESAA